MSREKKRNVGIQQNNRDLGEAKEQGVSPRKLNMAKNPKTIETLRMLHFAKLPQQEQFYRFGSVIVYDIPEESAPLSAKEREAMINKRTETLKDLERRVVRSAEKENISPEILNDLRKEVDADLVESLKQSIIGDGAQGAKSFKTIMGETEATVQSKIEALEQANASLAEALQADSLDIGLMDTLQHKIDGLNSELIDQREDLERELYERQERKELPIQPLEESELKKIIRQINQVKTIGPEKAKPSHAAIEKAAVYTLSKKLTALNAALTTSLSADSIDITGVEQYVASIDKITQVLKSYNPENLVEIMGPVDQAMAPYLALKQRVERLEFFGGAPEDIKQFSNQYNLADLNEAVKTKEQEYLSKMSVPLDRINSNPIAKEAKEYFNKMMTEIKDNAAFKEASPSDTFPQGIADIPFKAHLDYLVKQRDSGILDDKTYQDSVEALVGELTTSVERYLSEREKSFSTLLKVATSHAKQVENAPFAYQYDGNVHKDLAEPVKAAAILEQKIDLTDLKDPNKRSEALPEILTNIRMSERAAVELQKADDNLQRNLTNKTVINEIPVEMKSVNSGTPAQGTVWSKETVNQEFQQEHPELFGVDKLVSDSSKQPGDQEVRLTASEIAAIRQKAEADFLPDKKHALTKDDIKAANIKLSEQQIERIVARSEKILQEKGNGESKKIINELSALLKGPVTQKLSRTAAEIDQQINDMLDRVEKNSGIEAGVLPAYAREETVISASEQTGATTQISQVGIFKATVNWITARVGNLVNAVKGLFAGSELSAPSESKEDNLTVKSVRFNDGVSVNEFKQGNNTVAQLDQVSKQVGSDNAQDEIIADDEVFATIPDDLPPPPPPVTQNTEEVNSEEVKNAKIPPPPLQPRSPIKDIHIQKMEEAKGHVDDIAAKGLADLDRLISGEAVSDSRLSSNDIDSAVNKEAKDSHLPKWTKSPLLAEFSLKDTPSVDAALDHLTQQGVKISKISGEKAGEVLVTLQGRDENAVNAAKVAANLSTEVKLLKSTETFNQTFQENKVNKADDVSVDVVQKK